MSEAIWLERRLCNVVRIKSTLIYAFNHNRMFAEYIAPEKMLPQLLTQRLHTLKRQTRTPEASDLSIFRVT